jgi:hypothetical protein
MESKRSRRALRAVVVAAAGVGVFVALTASAGARPLTHGQFIHVSRHLNANQSNNWFGYNQGTLEQGSKQFNSITGDWTVPTVSQHTAGQDESSSDWIGIGGGCVDAACTVTDNTLIQTGTEQDVSSGTPTYSAWYELVPVPSLEITSLTVSPGDHMHASISETVAGTDVWNITITDVTKNQTFTTTVPYPSTHLSAEWIEETPLVFGTGGAGLASLPNLTNPRFDNATTNGAPAGLKSAEQVQLTDSSGAVIGTPSAPDAGVDGFSACSWAISCAAPAG